METLYLSGPMTGYPQNNKPAFNAMAKRLRAAGYTVINPAELDEKKACSCWEEYLKRDIKELMECNAIALLPEWRKSRGANLETSIGRTLSYPIHSATYWLKKAESRRAIRA